jgi:hypothetical protein
VIIFVSSTAQGRGSGPSKDPLSIDQVGASTETLSLPVEDKKMLSQSLNRRRDYELRLQRDPGAIGNVMSEIVAAMQANSNDDGGFSSRLSEFDHVVRFQEGKAGGLPENAVNNAAENLLGLYQRKQKSRPGWYLSIVDFAIKRSTSPGVRRFILAGLDKGPSGEQDQILGSLYWSARYHGDKEIYDKVLKLYANRKGDEFRSLALMARLDRGRTFPILRKRVNEARSVPEFNKLSSILSSDRTTEAMDLLLSKVKDFPNVPMDSKQSPTEGIYTEPLLDYIRQAEDERLANALEVLPRTPARIWSYSVLVEKLQSKSPKSRVAVMRCLKSFFVDGDFIGAESRAAISRHLEGEQDRGVLQEGQRALEAVDRQLRERK